MENNQTSIKNLCIKWGLINAVLGIIIFLLSVVLGLQGDRSFQLVSLVIFIVIVILAHNDFKSRNNGVMSYSKGLGIGTLISVIASIISSVFTFIYVSIDSSFIRIIKEKMIMQWEEAGMNDRDIEVALKFSEFFISPIGMAIVGIIAGSLFGFIIALIISAFTKREVEIT